MILKICGITNREDATAAVEAGANAIGFNFYEKSPRYIAPDRAAEIATPAGVRRVGVFVDEAPERVEEIGRGAGLHVAQLHGDESPGRYPRVLTVWKAARVSDGFDLAAYDGIPAEALVLDGPAGALYGGAGKTFDWSIVAGVGLRIVIAGGLDASNVERAVAVARPWGVDACSRIESAPGKKDHQKMNEFLRAARKALLS
jgi:phosphoribosylanthranilate isomerase